MGGGERVREWEREKGNEREREREIMSTLVYIIPVCIHTSQKLKATRYL